MKLKALFVVLVLFAGSFNALEILVTEKNEGYAVLYPSSFAISPDGSKIAYRSSKGVTDAGDLSKASFQMDIIVKDLTTGKFQKFYIPNYLNISYYGLMHMDWSPDGRKIAFTFGRNFVNKNLYIIDSDGNIDSLEQLTSHSTVFKTVAFSKDSNSIIHIKKPNPSEDFGLSYYDGSHIYSIDLKTKQSICLTCFLDQAENKTETNIASRHSFQEAVWSKDKSKIYYNSGNVEIGSLYDGPIINSIGTGFGLSSFDVFENNLVYVRKRMAGSVHSENSSIIIRDLSTNQERVIFESSYETISMIDSLKFYDNGEKIAFIGSYKGTGGIFSIKASGATCDSCPSDCVICLMGVTAPYCGDGICNEQCSSCPQDCGDICRPGYAVTQNGYFIRDFNGRIGAFDSSRGLMSDIMDLAFVDEKTGWIVGWNKYYFHQGSSGGLDVYPGKIFKTVDSGRMWVEQSMPEAGSPGDVNADAALYAVEAFDSNKAWAAGRYGLILRTTDGQTWEKVYGQTSLTNNLIFVDIDFIGDSVGYVVGYDSSSKRGVVMKTTNKGASWTKQNIGGAVRSVDFISENVGWISTESGTVYKTVDGGKNWNLQFSDSSGARNLYSIDFLNENVGFVAGGFIEIPKTSGVIYKTVNGGETWEVVSLNIEGKKFTPLVMSLSFISPSEGWASLYPEEGSPHNVEIIHTTDGGATWKVHKAGSNMGAITRIDYVMGNDESVETVGQPVDIVTESVEETSSESGGVFSFISRIFNSFKRLFGFN